jgi:hypothetical protein
LLRVCLFGLGGLFALIGLRVLAESPLCAVSQLMIVLF